MSKLLARAKVRLINAKNDYNYLSVDDAYIDDCCYNLQQAIEFSLKYLVEINGSRYLENHDIRAQMNKLKSLNIEIPCEDQLRRLATTINSWGVDTRYNDNFVALIEDIDECIEISNSLVEYCDKILEIK